MRILTILLAGILLAACTPASPTPQPTASPDTSTSSETPVPLGTNSPNPYAPQPGDASLTRGNAYLDSTQLNTMESYPLQYSLTLKGSLPTPCHQLRVEVIPPDPDRRININVYSVVDPNLICVQMLQSFEANIPLGSFPAGHYTLWVNAAKIAEFDS
jgi:hypothetical protein